MMEYSKVGDMAYVEFSPISIYRCFNDTWYKEIYSVRNTVMCNYLYL
jgi:DUF1365 family protein